VAGEEEDEGTARRFLERISYIISRWVSKSAKTETETGTGTKFSKFRMHFGELAELRFDLYVYQTRHLNTLRVARDGVKRPF